MNAISHGACVVLEHYSSLIYPSEEYVFRRFTSEFTKLRDLGLYYKIFGKNMVNGLYGSFALRDDDDFFLICLSDFEFSDYVRRVDVLSFKKIGNSYILRILKNHKSKKLFDKADY